MLAKLHCKLDFNPDEIIWITEAMVNRARNRIRPVPANYHNCDRAFFDSLLDNLFEIRALWYTVDIHKYTLWAESRPKRVEYSTGEALIGNPPVTDKDLTHARVFQETSH